MTDRFNLQAELKGDVTVTPEEHADVRAARLRTEARRDFIQDVKDITLFVVVLIAIVSIGVIAAYKGIWDAGASADTQRWSLTVLSAVLTGGISFLLGRKLGSK